MGDLLKIESSEDILLMGQQLKMAAGEDDDVKFYTKTVAAVEELQENVKNRAFSAKAVERLKSHTRAFLYEDKFYSIVLSKDNYHGHQWHVSMVNIVEDRIGPTLYEEVAEEVSSTILDIIFGNWKAVDNPGMMKAIKHFVGND